MESQFQGLEDDNNTSGLTREPVIPGTNLPIQTQVVVPEHSTEYLPPDAIFMAESTRADVEQTGLIGPLMTGLEEDPHYPKPRPQKMPPSNYQTKLTDPTGQGGEEVEVDPLLERLNRYHIHEQSPTVNQVMESDKAAEGGVSNSSEKPVTEYGHKVAEMLAPLKFGSGRGASVREYLEEKLRPGDDDKALSEAIFGRFRKNEEVVVVQPVGAGERSLGMMDRLKGAVGSSWIGKSTSDARTIPGVGAEHIKDKEHRG